jgi:type III restriction enzyme
MILKKYQKTTLSVLRDYLEKCRIYGPAGAYNEVTKQPEQAKRLGRYVHGYKPLNGLENTPYVCLRLPTGGGKTILAARSIAIARDSWVEKDYPTVLWLVPSNTIRQQTVEALKDPRHPYRKQMDEAFEGRVRIVGTIQTLRVDKTEGRKVYAHNEYMEPHFTQVPNTTPDLEKIEGTNKIKYSFANLLHMLHPIMIVDEAHNAVTGLSQEMQKRVSPSCILEFTATPRLNSNILHSATAQELKDAEMIKLPVVLAEHPNWQSAVDGAIQRREELAGIAEKDSKYIRPIVLFQAQKKNEEVTVEVLKNYLVETSGIDENKIAVATG